jgi:hypothetical protein
MERGVHRPTGREQVGDPVAQQLLRPAAHQPRGRGVRVDDHGVGIGEQPRIGPEVEDVPVSRASELQLHHHEAQLLVRDLELLDYAVQFLQHVVEAFTRSPRIDAPATEVTSEPLDLARDGLENGKGTTDCAIAFLASMPPYWRCLNLHL